MRLNPVRALAIAAVVSALLFAVSTGARQQVKGAAAPQATEAAAPSPPVKVKAAAHDHMAMEKGLPKSEGKYMTIVGEVMDPACFLEAGSKSIGPGHYQCAYDCARSGQTLALYDRDEDRIYFIAGELPGKNPNDPLIAYIHKKVDVSGTVYHRSDAWGIVITKVALHQEKPGAGGKGATGAATAPPAGARSGK